MNFNLRLFGKNFMEFRSGATLENPRYSLTDDSLLDVLFGDDAEGKITQQTALTYAAVWRAVSILSSTIATLPKTVFTRNENDDRIKLPDHNVQLLLNRPATNMNRFTWFERAIAFILLWGDAIAVIKRDQFYNPVALPLVHPKDVRVEEQGGKLFYKVPGYKSLLRSDQVVHVVGFGDGIRGIDPISNARESLSGGLIYQKTSNNVFKNGYLNDRFLTTPGRFGTDKTRQTTLDSIKNAYQGMRNAGKLLALEGGAELKSIGMPLVNMQFLESRKFQISEVARWFGVPPHKLYDLERSTNNNIEHQGIEFVTDSILGLTVRFETELQEKLFAEDEVNNHFIKFNINGLMRGDLKTRSEYYSKATGGRPWVTPDEVRKLEDMNKIGGPADELIDPANIVGNNNNNNQ